MAGNSSPTTTGNAGIERTTNMSNGFREVNRNNANAKRGIVPPHAVDGYTSQGTKTPPPAASRFDIGTSTREGAAEAADARREHSRKLGGGR